MKNKAPKPERSKIGIWLTATQKDEFELLCSENGRTMSDALREVLASYLTSKKNDIDEASKRRQERQKGLSND